MAPRRLRVLAPAIISRKQPSTTSRGIPGPRRGSEDTGEGASDLAGKVGRQVRRSQALPGRCEAGEGAQALAFAGAAGRWTRGRRTSLGLVRRNGERGVEWGIEDLGKKRKGIWRVRVWTQRGVCICENFLNETHVYTSQKMAW
jgi:hypothetical protein